MDDHDAEGIVHVVHAVELPRGTGKTIPKCYIQAETHPTKALIDTGASINIMAREVYEALANKPTLHPTQIRVYAYGNDTPLQMAGVFTADIGHKDTSTKAKVYVTTTGTGMPLSCRMTKELQLVKFAFWVHHASVEDLIKEFQALFE